MSGIDRIVAVASLVGLAACAVPPPVCAPTAWTEPLEVDPGPHVLPNPGTWTSLIQPSWGSSVALVEGAGVVGAPSLRFTGDPGDSGLSRDGDGAVLLPDREVDTFITHYLPSSTSADVHPFGETVESVGNVTGDARADFAIGYAGFGRLELASYRNGASGERYLYDAWVDVGGTRGLDAAACGDVDGQGRADLCTTGGVWAAPVGPGPAPLVSWPVVAHVASGDVDADGDPDLVLAEGSAVWWVPTPFTKTGAATLGDLAGATVTLDAPVTAVWAADLDGDCVAEVVLGTAADARVGHVDAAGFHEAFAVPGPVDALVSGDFDGDGTTDLVVGGGAEIRWLRGPVTSGTVPVVFRSSQHPADAFGAALAAEDHDGDGVWDLAIGDPRFEPPGTDTRSAVFWLEGLSP